MLSLTRQDGECVVLRLGETRIVIRVRKKGFGTTHLDIDAPKEVRIMREELEVGWIERKESR